MFVKIDAKFSIKCTETIMYIAYTYTDMSGRHDAIM